MSQRRGLLFFSIFFAILSFITPSGAVAGQTSEYTLDNGLKVILVENDRAQVSSALLWVKAGSADEGPDENGLAHLLEHMVFRGAPERGTGEIAREVEASGGWINAGTSYDRTIYQIDIASRFTDRALTILADMAFRPTLDPDDFKREKEVVIEEVKRYLDMPGQSLFETVMANAFLEHPYGRPILGSEKTVRALEIEQLRNFHQRFYTPDNMLLVVVGDFQTDELKQKVREIMGSVEAGPSAPAREFPAEPPQNQLRAFVERSEVSLAELNLGFHIPGYGSRETAALDLLSEILGRGRTARLYQALKRDRSLAQEVSAAAFTPSGPGLFTVSVSCRPERTREVIGEVLHQLNLIATSGVSEDELARAKLTMKADFIRSRTTMSGEAQVAAFFETLGGNFSAKDRYLDLVDLITVEDVRQAAAGRLKVENMTAGLLLPREALPEIDSAGLDKLIRTVRSADLTPPRARPENRAELEALEAAQAPGGDGSVKKFTLSNGAVLLVKVDNSLPLAAVRAAFLGGLRYENNWNNGINFLLTQVWDRGTAGLTAEELDRTVEDMAGDFQAFSGDNSIGLEAEFLTQYLDQGLEIFAKVLREPALSDAETERAKKYVLGLLEQQNDQPPVMAFRLFARTIFDGHPYAMNRLGSPETVSGLTGRDLREYYRKRIRPNHMVLTVVGNVEPEKIRDRFEELLSGWEGSEGEFVKPPQPKPQPGLRQVHENLDRNQAHMILGFLAPGLESEDKYAMEILNNILSGQGGMMFTRLRDELSLAYSLNAFYRPGLGVGSFGFYIAFDPRKTGLVQSELRKLTARILEEPIDPEDLARAKDYKLGVFEIGQQTSRAQAADLALGEIYGVGYHYREQYRAGIMAVTAEDVQRVARKYLRLEQGVEVLVGPEAN